MNAYFRPVLTPRLAPGVAGSASWSDHGNRFAGAHLTVRQVITAEIVNEFVDSMARLQRGVQQRPRNWQPQGETIRTVAGRPFWILGTEIMTRRHDNVLAATLARAAWELLEPQPLPRQILALLSNDRQASGAQLARVLRKRKTTVLRACRQLAKDGRLERRGAKWLRCSGEER